jgi:hypothetical protein
LGGDWILAARGASIFLGTSALVLLYPLARLFFDRGISILVVLVYAASPLFVHNGVIATKDSGAWFLVTLGMLLFAKNLGSSAALPFAGAGGVFVLAVWMRIDTLVFPICSIIYLLAFEKDRRGVKLASFLTPVVFVGVLGLGEVFFLQQGGALWARLGEILPRIELTMDGYRNLRETLRSLESNPPPGIPPEYFDQVRSITWVTGLAVVLRNIVEAYHLPLFAIFLAGLWTFRSAIKRDFRGVYFALILLLSLGFFYFHIFSCWILEQRWVGSAIVASFFFIGQGFIILRSFFDRYDFFRGKRSFVAVLAAVVLVATLPKALFQRDADKDVFVQIGEKMASADPKVGRIVILAPTGIVRWLSLYANRKSESAPYPDEFQYNRDSGQSIGSDYGRFISNLGQNKIQYLIWTDKHWPNGAFDLLSSYRASDLQYEGQWFHRDTGKIILFSVAR